MWTLTSMQKYSDPKTHGMKFICCWIMNMGSLCLDHKKTRKNLPSVGSNVTNRNNLPSVLQSSSILSSCCLLYLTRNFWHVLIVPVEEFRKDMDGS